jgi:hypothetical protein
MIYVIKFSNGLYLINPNFAYGTDSIEGVFTTDLNRARLFDDIATAERVAENLLSQCDSFPQACKAIAGGNYEIATVTVTEVKEVTR